MSKFRDTFFYLCNNISIPLYVMDSKSQYVFMKLMYGIGILEN